jgi:hypothetical protein
VVLTLFVVDVHCDMTRRETERHDNLRFCTTGHASGAASHQPEPHVLDRLATGMILHAFICVQAYGSVEALLSQIVEI